jgi:phage gp16-like protein
MSRRAAIAAIQIARQQLDMEETAYRDMLERVSRAHGKAARSAADLSQDQRQAVLEELRRLGATRAPRVDAGKPHNFASAAMPALITKVEALLADMKLSWSYADAIAQRQSGIAKVAWVRDADGLRAIIAALSVEQSKRALDHAVAQQLERLGWQPSDVAQRLPALRASWRRHRPSLEQVLTFLREQKL